MNVKSRDLILFSFIVKCLSFVDNVYELKGCGLDGESRSGSIEIMDPIGKDFDFYKTIFNELREEVTRVSKDIFTMALKKAGK